MPPTPSFSPVHIWQETVAIPTYPPPPPDPNPMFFEKRVNQGASGRVYPNPFTDHVNHEHKIDQSYQAVFLENEYLQLMVLPQFGGRVHAALDKTNGYDFVYRQHVIKPALIGLFGSWISGGMEFNWPLHHRPSTFMPVEYTIEHGADGSATVWLSEHEPMNRMKGMVGICLYAGKAYFEFKVQLYNRTPLPQPFLWWINCAVHVNEHYQIIFPPDVESVTYHSRSAMASYPVARQLYAGADWRAGVDISWLKNVVPATSYFANPSQYDFFGGYDHGKQAGIIHVADHHTSPGKKCFTWGTGEFGSAWQASLTDSDGPYIELMASSYSDNQPDFSWLQPYETKYFRHVWYPIQQIGLVKNANTRAALNLEDDFVGICVTEALPNSRVVVASEGKTILDQKVDLLPGKPFTSKLSQRPSRVTVFGASGAEIITYTPKPRKDQPLPPTAKPPKLPHQITSLEELYLTGLHVEQYLHFSLDPAPYWQRALQLDPSDARSNNALGRLKLRRGDFAAAEAHFRAAIETLTRYNFNPYDGEPYYNLGLALAWQSRYDEAYDAFYKAIWSYAWQSAAYFALAQIDMRRGDYAQALDHLERSLAVNAHHNQALALKVAALRCLGRLEAAVQSAQEALAFDPLNYWARSELVLTLQEMEEDAHFQEAEFKRLLRDNAQNYLDLAFDYMGVGFYPEAIELLEGFVSPTMEERVGDGGKLIAPQSGRDYPMLAYALGYGYLQLEDRQSALQWYRKAASLPPDWCFPHRIEEQIVLENACAINPADGRAAYYLGNLYYDKKQYEKAIAAWEAATRLEPSFAIPWRNLGIALYNKHGDKAAARQCYEKALAANPHDPRLLMEYDQLHRRLGTSPAERLSALERYANLVTLRDDLSVELATLYNQTGQPEKALQHLLSHPFHPWEGGEGQPATQYALAHLLLGKTALAAGEAPKALEHFDAAQQPPQSLGVGRAMQAVQAIIACHAAAACEILGFTEAAQAHYRKVLNAEAEWANWQPFSALTYYAALALQKLGDAAEARRKLQALLSYASERLEAESESGFYTSVPATVVFDEEPGLSNRVWYNYLMALAYKGLALMGLGELSEARKAFEVVLTLDPYHWEAQQELLS